MATTPRGVRSISEKLLKSGRALIITSEDYDDYDFASLPDGTLHVNTETGIISVKLTGETTWSPATLVFDKAEFDTDGKIINVQNPTLVTARDTQFNEEKFIVGSIDINNSTFIYYKNSKEENNKREKAICDQGFIFELEYGQVFVNRNHTEVFVNNTNIYTATSGEVSELSTTRIALNTDLKEDDIVCIRYVQWSRIGTPYPRIYLDRTEPGNPQTGDFWLDRYATIEIPSEDEEGNVVTDTLTTSAFRYYINGEWKIVYNEYLKYLSDVIANSTSEFDAKLAAEAKERADADILEADNRTTADNTLQTNINSSTLGEVSYSARNKALVFYRPNDTNHEHAITIPIGEVESSDDKAKAAATVFSIISSQWVKQSDNTYKYTIDMGAEKTLIGVWKTDNGDSLINVNSNCNGRTLTLTSYENFTGFALLAFPSDVVKSTLIENQPISDSVDGYAKFTIEKTDGADPIESTIDFKKATSEAYGSIKIFDEYKDIADTVTGTYSASVIKNQIDTLNDRNASDSISGFTKLFSNSDDETIDKTTGAYSANVIDSIISSTKQTLENEMSNVTVTTGSIKNGAAIPIPSGYTRAQCHYAVWPTSFAIYTYDTHTVCPWLSVNQSTGVVSFGGDYNHDISDQDPSGGSITGAAYLCIALK